MGGNVGRGPGARRSSYPKLLAVALASGVAAASPGAAATEAADATDGVAARTSPWVTAGPLVASVAPAGAAGSDAARAMPTGAPGAVAAPVSKAGAAALGAAPAATSVAAKSVAEVADLAPVAQAAACLGRTVAQVVLEVPAGENARALKELVDVRPGFPLDAAEVQATLERFYALGRFAQIEARVVPQGEAVVLRLAVAPIVRLDDIVLRGLKRVDDDGLRAALRLQPGDEVDNQTEALLRRRATAYLAQAGYPRARVGVRRLPGSTPATAAMHLAVIEGEADRVASVQLGGHPRLAAKFVLPSLPLRPGQVLDRAALERGRQALVALYQDHGFWRAEVRLGPLAYLPATPGAPRAARVRYEVAAHERLSFAFRGNHVLGDAQLRELWPSRVAGAPNSVLEQYASRIRARYGRESYPQARVRVALRTAGRRRLGAPPPHACEVAVDVDEGAPVYVTGITLEGAHSFPHEVLRRQIRAVLARELTHPSFFAPLGPADTPWSRAPSYGLDWAPHRVPPEQRWVPELYARAAEDIAAAYRAAGFVDVEVTVPPYLAQAALLPGGAAERGRGRPARTSGLGPGPLSASAVADAAVGPPAGPVADAVRRGEPEASTPFVRPGTPPPPAPAYVTARLLVREGAQHFVGRMSFAHNEQLGGKELLAVVAAATGHYQLAAPLRPGAPLSAQGVEDARIALLRHYRERGFFYARVEAQVAPMPGGAGHEVRFAFEEGPQVQVSHLLVRGNRHTREGVVRSRMALAPGELYRLDRAIADQQEIMALGTFRRARVRLVDEEHPSGQKDVVAEVEERPRQPVEVVPGLSTAAGPRLRLSYAHINVLGTASTFVASLKLNRQLFFRLYGPYADTMRERYAAYRGVEQLTRALEREVRFGLRSPRIKALPFDPLLRLDVVDQRLNAVRYGLDAATATFGIDTDPTPTLRVSLELQGGVTALECPLGDNCDQNPDVRRLRGGRPIQQGRRHTWKFGPTVRYDHRDDPVAPSRGYVLQGRLSQAFGAARPEHVSFPFAFTKYEGSATGYLPALGAVWASSFRFGVIQLERSAAPVDERFFLGGRDSLRGFVESTLIAQDACVVADPEAPLPAHCVEGIAAEPSPPLSLGGNSFLLWKNELRLPLGAGISFDLFVDVGNLWVDLFRAEQFALRLGTGVGLRYSTPVGAMTLDFGVNPARRAINQEAAWQFHFSIGSF